MSFKCWHDTCVLIPYWICQVVTVRFLYNKYAIIYVVRLDISDTVQYCIKESLYPTVQYPYWIFVVRFSEPVVQHPPILVSLMSLCMYCIIGLDLFWTYAVQYWTPTQLPCQQLWGDLSHIWPCTYKANVKLSQLIRYYFLLIETLSVEMGAYWREMWLNQHKWQIWHMWPYWNDTVYDKYDSVVLVMISDKYVSAW
jgi:hypothetical protein